MKIRTAIFGVYVTASAVGLVVLVAFILHDVRFRYVESMRRTLGDTAAFLAVFVSREPIEPAWHRRLQSLPPDANLLRVFACDETGRVIFDSAEGRDVGQIYGWPMRGGGRAASENYSIPNVAEVNGELRVAAAVRRAGQFIGWVGVGRPLASTREGISRARWELVTSIGWIAAVMVAAGWWISTRLTKSIERLTEYAGAVRDGRPAQPPSSQAHEVAALTTAFEEMRVALEGKAYVERYTQTLAHEIKAPLSSIRGAAELLAENPPPVDRVRFVANLRAETQRLEQIVERLLELAALEARRASVQLTHVDLARVVREVHSASEAAAAASGIALVVARAPATSVRGEEFLLVQAVGNLVQNALQFTPRGGKVTIDLQADGDRAIVAVEDTGPGVPDYALERIFDRFYSLPRPETGRKSSGLGLSIVREIVRLHGGEVHLENRPEGGARATLTLPVV